MSKPNGNLVLLGLAVFGVGAVVVAAAVSNVVNDDEEVRRIRAAYPASAPVAHRVVALARQIGAKPAWIANVIQFESQWNPQAINAYVESLKPGLGASGLIQFTPTTAAELGTTLGVIRRMGIEDQFTLVERYFMLPRIPRPTSQSDVFMAVFYPPAIGRGPDWLLGSDRGPEYVAKLQRENPGIKTAADYERKALVKAKMVA